MVGEENVMCPMAQAVRWVGGLEVMGMMWISEVGVRWGSVVGEGVGEEGLAVGVGGSGGGGIWLRRVGLLGV